MSATAYPFSPTVTVTGAQRGKEFSLDALTV
jgi:hypothetical protein